MQVAIWIVIGAGLLGLIIATLVSWLRPDDKADLGSVSRQWMTEHRAGEPPHR